MTPDAENDGHMSTGRMITGKRGEEPSAKCWDRHSVKRRGYRSSLCAPVTTNGGLLQRTYGSFYDGKYDAAILSLEKRQFQANYT